jgi:hypothetical protein
MRSPTTFSTNVYRLSSQTVQSFEISNTGLEWGENATAPEDRICTSWQNLVVYHGAPGSATLDNKSPVAHIILPYLYLQLDVWTSRKQWDSAKVCSRGIWAIRRGQASFPSDVCGGQAPRHRWGECYVHRMCQTSDLSPRLAFSWTVGIWLCWRENSHILNSLWLVHHQRERAILIRDVQF